MSIIFSNSLNQNFFSRFPKKIYFKFFFFFNQFSFTVKSDCKIMPKNKPTTVAVPLNAVSDENKFTITIGQYGWNAIVTVTGVHSDSEVVRNEVIGRIDMTLESTEF